MIHLPWYVDACAASIRYGSPAQSVGANFKLCCSAPVLNGSVERLTSSSVINRFCTCLANVAALAVRCNCTINWANNGWTLEVSSTIGSAQQISQKSYRCLREIPVHMHIQMLATVGDAQGGR